MHNFFPSNDSPESSNARSSPPPPPESSKAPMKKTLFYDFLPSKAVEDAERAQNIPHPVTCQLIEIRDVHPLPTSKSHDCPTLVKVIDEEEVFTNDSPESSNAQSSPPLPLESSKAPMNKTLFYDFLPSKAVEDAERAQNIPHPVTCQLIEIQDVHPLPTSESHECLTLVKVIDEEEVFTNGSPESSNAQLSPPPPPESSKAPMKKTLFYDFLPSKAVEDAERAQNIPHPVTCQLIEIRDVHPLPTSESHDCPTLVKVINEEEVFTEKLFFSYRRAFDYIFRHWPMPVVQAILMGGEHNVEILDYTDYDPGRSVGSGLWFCGESTFFAKLYSNDRYFLNMSEVFRARRVAVGDVIHCRWDTQNECFVLKVVRRET